MTKQDIHPAFEEMTRSLNVGDALRYGVDAALVLSEIKYWLFQNMIHGRNLREGQYWTFNTAEAYAKHFPFFSSTKIARLLRKLETDGALKSGCFNRHNVDRTKWYTTEKFKADSWKKKQSLTNKQPESSDINQYSQCAKMNNAGVDLHIDQCSDLNTLTNYPITTNTNTTTEQNSDYQNIDNVAPPPPTPIKPTIRQTSNNPKSHQPKKLEVVQVTCERIEDKINDKMWTDMARYIPGDELDHEWRKFILENSHLMMSEAQWLLCWSRWDAQYKNYKAARATTNKRPNQRRNSTGGVTYDNDYGRNDGGDMPRFSKTALKSINNIIDVELD